MGDIYPMVHKQPLTEEQQMYWEARLEIAERQVEYCKRMLGMLAVEQGVTE